MGRLPSTKDVRPFGPGIRNIEQSIPGKKFRSTNQMAVGEFFHLALQLIILLTVISARNV